MTGPDLSIAPEDFYISDLEPDLGQTVHMMALVRNIGDQDAYNVTVRFVDWFETNMTIIEDVYVGHMAAGEVRNVSTDWTAGPVGLHLMEAIADPNDIIPEIDEGNNVAFHGVVVHGQQPVEDAPWPMFRQNLNHTGLSPYDTSGNTGKLEWSFQTGHIVESSPAIGSDGTIYVGSADNFTYAINPDGSEKWRFWTGTVYQSSPAIGPDGTIYIGSIGFIGQNDSKLYAINPDGTEKWSVDNLGIRSSPVIGPDGTVYVGSCDSNLYAINPTGTEKWRYGTASDIHSSPAIGSDGAVYVGSTDGHLYAVNPDGSKKWTIGVGLVDYSSPAIGSDGTIYIGSHNGRLVAVNPNGSIKWAFMTGGHVETSAGIGSDGTIYFGSYDNKVYALNPDGSEKWHFTTNGDVESSPAIGAEGTIFIGSNDNRLYAINPNGSEKWHFAAGSHVYSSPAIGADGTIYVGSHYGKLYAVGRGKPDLTIAGIHFSDDTPEEGQTVVIWAYVHNIGTQDAYNVTIQFVDWFEGIQLPLPEAIIDFIPAGSYRNATTVWLAIPAGNHTIEVTADPYNWIPEGNEGNNVATRCVTVAPAGGYQIFVQATMFDNDNDGKYDDVVILVYDSNNHAIEGASIFVNGVYYGLTADTGLLVLENFSLGTYHVDAVFGSLSAKTTFYSEG
jgi:outer membrane protein assembly factor BamB